MSSKLNKKSKTPDYQKKLISKDGDNCFARIHEKTLYDERFLSITPMARIIYIAMIIECGKNKDSKVLCKFPYSAYSKLCSKPTFIKCKRELIENGFIIEKASYRTTSNIYQLCGDWKSEVIPKREPEYHDISEHDKLLKGKKT